MHKIKPVHLYYLAALDLAWAGLAIQYDWPRLAEMPIWAVLFTAICPLYPLLLSLIFLLRLFRRPVPALLAGWAYMGSLGYGLLALVFYPMVLIQLGWDWWTVGSIFWVLAYAVQGLLLVTHLKGLRAYQMVALFIFFLLADILNYRYLTFSYFMLEDISPASVSLLFISALLIHLAIFVSIVRNEWLSLFYAALSSKINRNR